eukprot:gb/GFBE01011491.1/.p1 GENE.gb/GFBE01011491.1/~~gb/GFBE01011491.1/.p1  ORF type:complete len:790 (+),score=156.16 gb/GFBE01011491.1/:1-2370(+)
MKFALLAGSAAAVSYLVGTGHGVKLSSSSSSSCDVTIKASDCEDPKECARLLNEALGKSGNAVCLERGEVYHLACSNAQKFYAQESKYAIGMVDVSNVSLRAVGEGTEKAMLSLDFDTRRCGFFMAVKVNNFEMEDIGLDTKQGIITLAEFQGIKGEDVLFKVFEDTPLTTYDLSLYKKKTWLGRVTSMRPLERGDDKKWHYGTDSHTYRFDNPDVSVIGYEPESRILTLRGVTSMERKDMAEIPKDRVFRLHGEGSGFEGVNLVRSRDISLKGVIVYQTTGTAFDAWACHNVAMTDCGVIRRGERPFSTVDGAMAFRSCTGDLRIEGGTFEGYGDDGLAISHLYHQILHFGDGDGDNVVVFDPPAGTPLPWAAGQTIVFQDKYTLKEVLRTQIVDVDCDQWVDTGQYCDAGIWAIPVYKDWFFCCNGGWGKVKLTLAHSTDVLKSSNPAHPSAHRYFAILPDHVPDRIVVKGNSFGQCRCKGITLAAGDKTSVIIKDNKIAATSYSAICIVNGPARGRFLRMQGPFAGDIVVENNDLSVEVDHTTFSKGGYKPQWTEAEDDISVGMAPIVVGAITSDDTRANHIHKGSPLYGTVTISENKVTLGGMPSKCPTWAYCSTLYHWFPDYAISVDNAKQLHISGNVITDRRLTRAGTPLVLDTCEEGCSDNEAPTFSDLGVSCSTVDEKFNNYLKDLCTTDEWKSQEYCAQSCADQGYGYKACCPRKPDYIVAYNNDEQNIESNICGSYECTSAVVSSDLHHPQFQVRQGEKSIMMLREAAPRYDPYPGRGV